LYKNPRHPYTLGLMASVPRLDGEAGRPLVPIDGQPPDLANLPPGCAFSPRCRPATPPAPPPPGAGKQARRWSTSANNISRPASMTSELNGAAAKLPAIAAAG